MKKLTNLSKKQKIIIGMSFLLVTCYMILLVQVATTLDKYSHREISLNQNSEAIDFNDGWKILIDNNLIDVSLDGFINADKSNTIKLTNKLISDIGYHDKILFCTSNTDMQVFINGQLRYSYSNEEDHYPKYLLRVWHNVELQSADENQLIEIVFTNVDKKINFLKDCYIGTSSSIFKYFLKMNIFEIILSIGLIVAGITLFSERFFGLVVAHNFSKKLFISLVAILIGIWGISGSNLISMMHEGNILNSVFYLCSASLVPLFYLLFIKTIQSKRLDFLLYLSIAISVILNFEILILLIMDSAWINNIIYVNSLLIIIALIIHFFKAQEYYLTSERMKKYYLYFIVSFVLLMLSFVCSSFFGVTRGETISISALVGFFIFFITILSIDYIHSSTIIENEKKLNEKMTTQLVSLAYSQIKPHFLHNTLTSIRYLIKSDPNTAYQLISDFSDYLRTNLNAISTQDLILFKEEIEHIHTYVRIEKVRFGERINVVFLCNCEDFKIPALSIQPLVENAIKHGICKKIEGGTVVVKSYKTNKYYVVEIKDDGVGFNPKELIKDDEHVGLANSIYRLEKMLYATIDVHSSIGIGTHIVIKIPRDRFPLKIRGGGAE